MAVRRERRRPGSGGGHGQGALRGAASAGRGRLGGAATPVTAIFRRSGRRQCPAASRLTRVFASFHARPPVVLRLRISGATILAVTGAVRAAQTGFCRVSCSPRGGQPHTMRHDNTTECARMAIRRKVLRDAQRGRWPWGRRGLVSRGAGPQGRAGQQRSRKPSRTRVPNWRAVTGTRSSTPWNMPEKSRSAGSRSGAKPKQRMPSRLNDFASVPPDRQ